MDSIPTWQEGGTQPDRKSFSKESCWQCFKLYSLDVDNSKYKEGSKGFCAKACYDKYNAANSKTCTCGKVFVKTNGEFALGKWFCSENCMKSDPDFVKQKAIQDKIAGGMPQEEDDDEEVEIDL